MGVRLVVDTSSLQSFMSGKLAKLDRDVIEQLERSGEQLVAAARFGGDYNDITGNLRSSIGYKVFRDGEEVSSNFQLCGNGTDQAQGRNTGETVADSIGESIPFEYSLVAVAGMHYARAVEAKGRSVFTPFAVRQKGITEKAFNDFER